MDWNLFSSSNCLNVKQWNVSRRSDFKLLSPMQNIWKLTVSRNHKLGFWHCKHLQWATLHLNKHVVTLKHYHSAMFLTKKNGVWKVFVIPRSTWQSKLIRALCDLKGPQIFVVFQANVIQTFFFTIQPQNCVDCLGTGYLLEGKACLNKMRVIPVHPKMEGCINFCNHF